jgi:hypothetical protein
MSDTPTYSFRSAEYRKDGEPIDALVELVELRGEVERLRERVEFHGSCRMLSSTNCDCSLCQKDKELAALREQLTAAEFELSHIRAGFDEIMDKTCMTDARHCTCVQYLRIELARLREQLMEAREAAQHYFGMQTYFGLIESDHAWMKKCPWLELWRENKTKAKEVTNG